MSLYAYITMFLIISVLWCSSLFAQGQDSVDVATESVMEEDTLPDKGPKPGSVALRSAIIPGWGQVVNRQIWKVPIIYAGLGGLAYLIKYNNEEYLYYRDLWRADSSQLALQYRESYRRDRDLFIIITVTAYAANILDAYVFAHLRDFDVSEDLSLATKPVFFSNIANSRAPVGGAGISLQFKFR